MVYDSVNIELIQQRVAILLPLATLTTDEQETYLRDGSGKDDYFVQFPDPFHKSIHPRSLDYIDIMILSFDFHRDGKISLMENLRRC
jgi:hypothetical protein